MHSTTIYCVRHPGSIVLGTRQERLLPVFLELTGDGGEGHSRNNVRVEIIWERNYSCEEKQAKAVGELWCIYCSPMPASIRTIPGVLIAIITLNCMYQYILGSYNDYVNY